MPVGVIDNEPYSFIFLLFDALGLDCFFIRKCIGIQSNPLRMKFFQMWLKFRNKAIVVEVFKEAWFAFKNDRNYIELTSRQANESYVSYLIAFVYFGESIVIFTDGVYSEAKVGGDS